MGSSLSPEQESLIRDNTSSETRIIVMLDEDEAGRAGRDEIAARLVKGRFVKVIAFPEEGLQPEDLSEEELAGLL
jgi:DNA primase